MSGSERVDTRLDAAGTLERYLERGARANAARLLGRLRAEDVAALLGSLGLERQLEVFSILETDFPDTAGEVLAALGPADRLTLLENVPSERIATLLARSPVDDAVFVVESLPVDLQERILEHLDLGTLRGVGEQLAYPEGSAGRLMDPDYFALPEDRTVREAIEAIQQKRDVEMIFYLYVVDRDDHLVGVTSLRQLLLARPESTLSEIMQRNVIKTRTDSSQAEVAELAARYDLLAIPVVDDQNHLVGIVTVDDVLDVLREEATDNLLKVSGSSEGELLYEGRTFLVAGLRLRTMLASLVGLLTTGWVLYSFQTRLDQALHLLTLVPFVMGIGGVVSAQAGAATLRVLGTLSGEGESSARVRGKLVLIARQMKVALVLAGVGAGLAGIVGFLLRAEPYFPALAAVAVASSVLVGAVLGTLVPLGFARAGLDPAAAIGPWLSAVLDVVGLAIYFGLARLALGAAGG